MEAVVLELSKKRRAELLAGPYTRLLSEHEEQIADLYSLFAEVIKGARLFWEELAQEELAHKTLVEQMNEKFRDGEWRFTRPSFVSTAILDSCGHIEARKKMVVRNGVSMREALTWAMELERGLVESEFFSIIKADNAEMMDLMNSLKSDSLRHLGKIEREARRLKWRIAGSRKHDKKAELDSKAGSAVLENVRIAQAAMIGHLVSIEESVSLLYSTYSKRIDVYSGFWASMAAEEMQHAAMLRKLYTVLEKGNVFYNVARFNRKSLLADMDGILDIAYNAKYNELSHYIAINEALKIERHLIDSDFYQTVESDAPEFKFIADRMISLSRDHMLKLEAAAGEAVEAGAEAARPAGPYRK